MIFFYCLYAFVNDLLIIKLQKDLTFTLLSLFTVVEYILFSFAIYLNLKKTLFKKLILWISPIFIAFTVFQFFNSGVKNDIDNISITIEYILLITYCLFYFFEELNQPNTSFIYSSHPFWIIIGVLIYSTGTFFLFMQSSNLSDPEWDRWLIINYIFNILKNFLFCIAIVMQKDLSSNHKMQNSYDEFFEKPITPL